MRVALMYMYLGIIIRIREFKSILVFSVGAFVEMAQFFDVPIFGRTFDPVDFAMYGIGVVLAVVLDTTVFPQIFDFWMRKINGSP